MATVVPAEAGDTLCSIAVRQGFINCDRLRAEPANKAYLTRALAPKDLVTVPDRDAKDDAGKATAKKHQYQRKGVPIPSVRFVHGSKDKPLHLDPALSELQISNFVTTRAGTDGTKPLPAGYGYHKDGDADPDAFKVEVVDPGAGGATVEATLDALRPVYDGTGAVVSLEPFKGAEAGKRSQHIICQSAGGKRFRSRYLRLVTDDTDKAAIPDQTLLVTDTADGKGGANDRLEILDQQVRASYVVAICKAASNKCTVTAAILVGKDRQRIRLCFHVYRSTKGGAGVSGTTEEMVRLRAGRWFRRIYAQASLSYTLVDAKVGFLDPPEANMLVISDVHGQSAAGDGAGGPSTLSFVLVEEDAWFEWLSSTTVTVKVPLGTTPVDAGTLVVAGLPADYAGDAFENPTCIGMANPSCDVVIRKANSKRIMIRKEKSTDIAMSVTVARVDLKSANDVLKAGALPAQTPDLRRIIRGAPGADDRLETYVVEGFATGGLRGRAFPPLAAWGTNASKAPLRYSTIVATHPGTGPTLDASDNDFANHPHESGHVLMDGFHADPTDPNNDTELMMGNGTTVLNSVTGSKRICDTPNLRKYQVPTAIASGAAKIEAISAVDRLRTNAAGLLDGW